jgi:hypothetical protein
VGVLAHHVVGEEVVEADAEVVGDGGREQRVEPSPAPLDEADPPIGPADAEGERQLGDVLLTAGGGEAPADDAVERIQVHARGPSIGRAGHR